jgi:chromosome partitioning protein
LLEKEGELRMPVISLYNEIGGVGKSTICLHLAGALAQAGRRVLLLDNTADATLTRALLGVAAATQLTRVSTIAAAYRGLDTAPEKLARPSGVAGVDLVPSSAHLKEFRWLEPQEADWRAQHAVREFLGEVRKRYDVVLIDCPFEQGLLGWAALVASDGFIVPVEPDMLATNGIEAAYAMASEVRARVNPGLRLLGCLVNRVKGTARFHQILEQTLRRMYGADVFATTVPSTVAVSLGNHKGRPVAHMKPRSAAAQSMNALAEELDWRLAGRTCCGPRWAHDGTGGRLADRFGANMEEHFSGSIYQVR